MVENKIKIMNDLYAEINDLKDIIKKIKNSNEILKLNIKKKELLLQKSEI